MWEALRTYSYWITQIADGFSGWIYPAVTINIIPYLTDIGISPVIAATTLGFIVFMSTPGRIVEGIVSDRLSTKNIKYLLMDSSLTYSFGMLLFVTLVSTTKIVWFIYASLALFRVDMGISSTARPILYASFFGRKNFGKYDVTGNYMSALTAREQPWTLRCVHRVILPNTASKPTETGKTL